MAMKEICLCLVLILGVVQINAAKKQSKMKKLLEGFSALQEKINSLKDGQEKLNQFDEVNQKLDKLIEKLVPACEALTDPSNGQVKTPAGLTVGSKATYSCNSGFELNGNSERECLADLSWSEMQPNCSLPECEALTDPSNGQVKTPTGLTVGSKATYLCNSGFVLTIDSERECLADLTWSGMQPNCSACDKHHRCPSWASTGECDKNPSYMLIECRKSCNTCGEGSGGAGWGGATNPNICIDRCKADSKCVAVFFNGRTCWKKSKCLTSDFRNLPGAEMYLKPGV